MNSRKSLSLLVPLGFNFAFAVISFFAAIPSILRIGKYFVAGKWHILTKILNV